LEYSGKPAAPEGVWFFGNWHGLLQNELRFFFRSRPLEDQAEVQKMVKEIKKVIARIGVIAIVRPLVWFIRKRRKAIE
jgi:hypothetical protein